uniref:CSON006897 protein n=1 Tax=Culicoides sonorensis TaxID=179676 RepID=A0A336LXK4_CULSO
MFKIIILLSMIGISIQQDESQASVLRFDNVIGPETGQYEYAYETSNGIKEEAQGEGGKFAKGFFEYTSPEGTPVRVEYFADDNGFQPEGDVLPTPHPAVAKAIEYLKNNLPKQA